MATVGFTIKVLPDPTMEVPIPHPCVYHFHEPFVPKDPPFTVSIAEVPEQIVLFVALDITEVAAVGEVQQDVVTLTLLVNEPVLAGVELSVTTNVTS